MSRMAEDTVHRKVLLVEDLATREFRDIMHAFVESARREKDMFGPPLFTPGETGDTVCDELTHVLSVAENFCVAADMMDLALAMAPTMPDEPLLPYDIPSMAGFMWFTKPYRQIDIRRKLLSTDCMVWEARNQRVKLWHFTSKYNGEDWVNQVAKAEGWDQIMPALSLNHVFDLRFGEQLPRGYSWDTPLPFDARVVLDEVTNPDGSKSWRMSTDHYVDITEPPTEVRSPMSAFIVCLWRLCQQTLAAKEHEPVPRSQRRRLGRMGVPDKPITVIRLRKRERKAEHEEAGVEWDHRWMVRGHWRHQPYKEDGHTVYRWILIHPFIKGPPDKPLLVRDKVNYLVR